MLSGDEFFRTKPDTSSDSTNGKSHNSYNKSYECNQLDWSLKAKNMETISIYQRLISLKQKVSGLHLGKEDSAKMSIDQGDGSYLVYEVQDTANNRVYKIAHHCGVNTSTTVDFSGYSLYLDTLNLDGMELSARTPLQPYQTIIAYK